MLKIVSTMGTSFNIEEVISKARKYIVIVTPYLKITPPILIRLMGADRRGVKILLVYGKSEISKEEQSKLKNFENLNLYFLDNLHAKCYLNESFGIMTSMNLYEYSQINNFELGLLFNFDDEDNIMVQEQLLQEIDLIFDSAEPKQEKFKRFHLLQEPYLSRLSNLLNSYLKTENFVYLRDVSADSFNDEILVERIVARYFPNNNINIKIDKEGSRIEFLLNFTEVELKKLESKLDLEIFSDEFRVYQNKTDCISMYWSVFHRDKWHLYSDEYVAEYLAKGIKRVTEHILEKFAEINSKK